MNTRRISELIVKAYGSQYNLAPGYTKLSFWKQFEQRIHTIWLALWPVTRNARLRFLGATLVIAFLSISIYYFNIILAAEHEMLRNSSQVEVLMQRRHDLSMNLAKCVQDYSNYERQVLTELIRLRGIMPFESLKTGRLSDLARTERKALSVPSPSSSSDVLSPQDISAPIASSTSGLSDIVTSLTSLLAIAEQYPDLKLSANFQSLMTALVEVEKDLASERIKFNNSVTVYWDYVDSIPSNVFAALFGFKSPSYFQATEEARNFKAIN